MQFVTLLLGHPCATPPFTNWPCKPENQRVRRRCTRASSATPTVARGPRADDFETENRRVGGQSRKCWPVLRKQLRPEERSLQGGALTN